MSSYFADRAQARREEEILRADSTKGFPHGISCRDCREVYRCNQCGRSASFLTESIGGLTHEWNWQDRCTNGRCPDCCRKECKHVSY